MISAFLPQTVHLYQVVVFTVSPWALGIGVLVVGGNREFSDWFARWDITHFGVFAEITCEDYFVDLLCHDLLLFLLLVSIRLFVGMESYSLGHRHSLKRKKAAHKVAHRLIKVVI